MEQPYYGISSQVEGAAVRLRLSGELDINVRDDLLTEARAAVATAGPGGVLVDFADTTFLESEAMGALIEALNAAREEDVAFTAINAHGMVLRVLQISGVLDLFDRPADQAHMHG